MMEQEGLFSRNIWAFLSLELWQQQFHDVHRANNLGNKSSIEAQS